MAASRLASLRAGLSLVTVEPVLFFYMLGMFLLFGVIHNMLYGRLCMDLYSPDVCLNLPGHPDALSAIQAETNFWVKVSTFCLAVPSILVDCYMGAWSDYFGRKITLLLPPLGALLGAVVYSVIAAYPSVNIRWICLASFFTGAFGSFSSVHTGVLAYLASTVADVQTRTSRMGVLMSMTFLAGTIGPFLSGLLVTNLSQLAAFVAVGACHLAAVVYIAGWLPNTKAGAEAERWSWGELFSSHHLKDSVKTCFRERPGGGRRKLVLLFLMGFVTMTVTAGELDIFYSYFQDPPLQLSYSTFSYWFGSRYGLSSLALLIVFPILKKTLGLTDTTLCAIGFVSKILALVVLGLSTNEVMVFAEVVINFFDAFALTSIRAMASQHVEDAEQGKLYGLFAVIEDICLLSGSAIFNTFYPLTRSFFNGTMFLVAAVALLLPLGLTLLLGPKRADADVDKDADVETPRHELPEMGGSGEKTRT